MIRNIIDKKFNEWTIGLNYIEQRIRIFNQIRDIPYRLIPDIPSDYDKSLIEILIHKRGSCSPKHFTLGTMYSMLSLQVKYVSYPFYWKDLDVDYPLHIRKLAEEMPLSEHLACKVLIDNKYVVADATWDSPLKKAGFPINGNWDGFSDTLLAVNSLDEIVHENVEGRLKYIECKKRKSSLAIKFAEELNKWLEEIRAQ